MSKSRQEDADTRIHINEPAENVVSVRKLMTAGTINLILVVLYLVLGGAIIMAMEKPHEEDAREDRWAALRTIHIGNNMSLGDDTLSAISIRKTLQESGGCSAFLTPEDDYDFDFTGSVFFALTVVTTIGYGNFVPKTSIGQWFVVFYSLLGISLILSFIFQTSHIWLMIVNSIIEIKTGKPVIKRKQLTSNITFDDNTNDEGLVDAKCLRKVLQEVSHQDQELDESIIAFCMYKSDQEETGRLDRDGFLNAIALYFQISPTIPKPPSYSMVLASFVVSVVWTILWGWAIGNQEEWSFRHSLWYGFATLTTIGFGDYAPDTHLGRVLAFLFIFVGLGIVAWFIQSLLEIWHFKQFWSMQRLYERGVVSHTWMQVRGYIFLSPLGDPRAPRLGPCVILSYGDARQPTLSVEYRKIIDSENPRHASEFVKKSKNASKEEDKKKTKEVSEVKTNGKVRNGSISIELDDIPSKADYQPLKDTPESDVKVPTKTTAREGSTSPPRPRGKKGKTGKQVWLNFLIFFFPTLY